MGKRMPLVCKVRVTTELKSFKIIISFNWHARKYLRENMNINRAVGRLLEFRQEN